MTQASPSAARATRSLKRSTGTMVQFGPQLSASSSTRGRPSRRESSRANAVLPEPVEPTTEIRFREALWLSGRRLRRVRGSRLHRHQLVLAEKAVSLTRRREDLLDTRGDLLGLLVRCVLGFPAF